MFGMGTGVTPPPLPPGLVALSKLHSEFQSGTFLGYRDIPSVEVCPCSNVYQSGTFRSKEYPLAAVCPLSFKVKTSVY